MFLCLIELGYVYDKNDRKITDLSVFNEKIPFAAWPTFMVMADNNISMNNGYASSNVNILNWPESAVEIFEQLNTPPPVKLNDNYTAILSKCGLEIGCQKISWEEYDDFCASVDYIRSNHLQVS